MEYTYTYIIENNLKDNNLKDNNLKDNKCIKLMKDFIDCYKEEEKNTTFIYQKAHFDSCYPILKDIKKACSSHILKNNTL